MDLSIEIELQGELLVVTAAGSVRFAAVSRLFKQVWEAAAEKRVNKILLNFLATEGELATFERYDLAVEAAEYLTEHRMNLRLAFVGKPPTMNGFGLRVARNRGIVTEVFPTGQEALRWLDD